MRDAQADAPAIHFKFRLAGATRTDATAQAGECVARADEVRCTVPQLRKLDLQLALTRPRMAREYVKDEHRAIGHGDAIQHLFQCRALARTQCVECDNEVRIFCTRDLRNFLDLALTKQRGWIRSEEHT